jgi:hypothetical protein
MRAKDETLDRFSHKKKSKLDTVPPSWKKRVRLLNAFRPPESGGLRVALGVLRGALGGRWPPGTESACVGGMLEAITSIAESAEYACLVR